MKDREEPALVHELREAIQKSGLSLTKLAEMADTSDSQLSRFMRGERGLTIDVAGRVCEALGLHLVAGEGASTPAPKRRKPTK